MIVVTRAQAKTALSEMSLGELLAYFRILVMGESMLMSRDDRRNNKLHKKVVAELLEERGINANECRRRLTS